MTTCPNCGGNIDRSNTFCSSCGFNLKEYWEKQEKEEEGKPKKESTKKPTAEGRKPSGLIIIAILILVGIVGFVIAGTTYEVPYEVEKEYQAEEPYQTTETYYEREPYQTTEEVRVPYQATKKTSWDVSWKTITGERMWGSEVGKSTFPATFYYDWGDDTIYRSYSDYIGFVATAEINVPRDGPVYFRIGSDDGSKLYVDGNLVIDNWGDHGYRTKDVTRYLTEGKYDLKLYYYDIGLDAAVSFSTDNDVTSWEETKYRTEEKTVTKYRKVKKTREVTKYRTITKTKTEIKYRPLFEEWGLM